VPLTANRMDLFHLPVFVHWHPPVGLGHIGLPHDKFDVTVRSTKGYEGCAKLSHGVQREVGNVGFVDHSH
jgi:hypothetical protein